METMKCFKKLQFKGGRLGGVMVMTALGALFMVGLTSLVTDAGWLYYQKGRLQTAVNAGWKAGYDRMVELGSPLNETKKADITQRVKDVMAQNGYDSTSLASVQVNFPSDKTLEVIDTKNIGLFFSNVYNRSSATVAGFRGDLDSNHAGGICPLAIPWGVTKDIDRNNFRVDFFNNNDPNAGFASGGEYILKLGSGGGSSDSGNGSGSGSESPTGTDKQKNNFGVIDPDNTNSGGANDYRDRFKYGYSGALQINDRLLPESGNNEGPTDQGVSFRINGDSTASSSPYVIIPITDIGPEVAVNNSQNVAATSIYDLQGTDHPNGAYATASYAFGASVRIIGFAEFKIISPDQYTRVSGDITTGDSGSLGAYQTGQVRGIFVRYIVKPGEVPLN